MQIIAGEVALRDETRELNQSKSQLEADGYSTKAQDLANTQDDLISQTDEALNMIFELPDAKSKFGKDIAKIENAKKAMYDASDILAKPDTSGPAIAAETEAIEWLLQAKRSSGGGGGGGNNAGNGSRQGGTSNMSALALLGDADASESKIDGQDSRQATGKSGQTYPEEFQGGLDVYFEMLEQKQD